MMQCSDAYLFRDIGFSEMTFMEGESRSELEKNIIATRKRSFSVQPARNLPNILKNSNRSHKNYVTHTLSKINDVLSVSDAKIVKNIPLDLNATLGNLKKQCEFDKITSPKLHNQRKQVHNPFDVQYDTLDWNSNRDKNKDKDISLSVDKIDIRRNEKNTSARKSKLNSGRKSRLRSFDKKSKIANRKFNDQAKKSNKIMDLDSVFAYRDVINDDVFVQNSTNPCNNDILNRPVFGFNTSDNQSDVFYRNEIYSLAENYDVNRNNIVPDKSAELKATQRKTYEEEPLDYEFSNLEEELADENIVPNFLSASNVLYTCTCKNCTSPCDKDLVLYEDAASSEKNETELFTDFYDSYDFHTSEYFQVLGDDCLKDFEERSLCFEECEEANLTTESVDDTDAVKSIESNADVTFSEQDISQNSQTYHIDKRMQDICTEPYPTEYIIRKKPIQPLKSINVDVLNERSCFNLENVLMEENKAASPDVSILPTAVSVNSSSSLCERQLSKNEKASKKYFIQCTYCQTLFNKNQLEEHLAHCIIGRIDSGDFKCYVCHKMYRYKASFLQHMKTAHHSFSNICRKNYVCNKCEKLYVKFRSFQKHLLLHDNDNSCDKMAKE